MKVQHTVTHLSDAVYNAAEKVEKALEQAIASAQVGDDARPVLELAQAVNAGTDPLALTHVMKILIRLAMAQGKDIGPLASAPFDVALDAVSGLQTAIMCQMAETAAMKATPKRATAPVH